MDDSLSIGWCQDRARSRRRVYQRLLGFNMFLHVVVGLLCMFAPYFVSETVGLPRPEPTGWIRGWGATLILVTALYIPGLRSPDRARYPNVAGILGRIWMATTWFVIGGNFFWLGLFDAVFAALIAFFYYRLAIAELQSRP